MIEIHFKPFLLAFSMSSFASLIVLNILNKRRRNNLEVNHTINLLNILFHDIKSSHVKIIILEKSAKDRYIKLGVDIDIEGIIDALIDESPLDLVKEQVRLHQKMVAGFREPFKIDVILIE